MSFASDLRKLAGDSVIVLASRFVSIGGAFAAHTLLVRNLEPSLLGQLSLAVTIASVCAGFSAIGMGQTVTRFISADDGEADSFVVIGIVVVSGSGIALMGAALLARGALESFFATPGLADLLEFLVVLVVLRPLAKLARGVVRGFERTKSKAIAHDILPFVVVLPVLYHFVRRGEALLGGVAFYVLRPIVQTVLLSLTVYLWDGWSFRPILPTTRQLTETVSFAWPLAFETLVVIFLGSIDILMLGRLLTSGEVGLYRSIQPVSKTLLFLLQALTFVYLPIATRYFTEGDDDRLAAIYRTATRWASHATFPLLLFYLAFGNEFIRVFFTEDYAGAWAPLAVLSIGMYSRVLAGPNGTTIKAIDRTREDLLATGGALATNFALNYALIPTYGAVGAAFGTAVGFLVYNAIELAIIYWDTGISPFHRALFAPLVPTAIATLALRRFVGFHDVAVLDLVLLGLFLCVAHAVSIAVTTGLNTEDRLLIEHIRGDRA